MDLNDERYWYDRGEHCWTLKGPDFTEHHSIACEIKHRAICVKGQYGYTTTTTTTTTTTITTTVASQETCDVYIRGRVLN